MNGKILFCDLAAQFKSGRFFTQKEWKCLEECASDETCRRYSDANKVLNYYNKAKENSKKFSDTIISLAAKFKIGKNFTEQEWKYLEECASNETCSNYSDAKEVYNFYNSIRKRDRRKRSSIKRLVVNFRASSNFTKQGLEYLKQCASDASCSKHCDAKKVLNYYNKAEESNKKKADAINSLAAKFRVNKHNFTEEEWEYLKKCVSDEICPNHCDAKKVYSYYNKARESKRKIISTIGSLTTNFRAGKQFTEQEWEYLKKYANDKMHPNHNDAVKVFNYYSKMKESINVIKVLATRFKAGKQFTDQEWRYLEECASNKTFSNHRDAKKVFNCYKRMQKRDDAYKLLSAKFKTGRNFTEKEWEYLEECAFNESCSNHNEAKKVFNCYNNQRKTNRKRLAAIRLLTAKFKIGQRFTKKEWEYLEKCASDKAHPSYIDAKKVYKIISARNKYHHKFF